MSVFLNNMVDVWNNGATTFTGIKLDVTDTASATASKLLDLLVGGTSKFNIRKDGAINIGGGLDLYLFRDAANTLAQRNGTAAQTFNLYNTYTDASNYETATFAWLTNELNIGAVKAGTGSLRNLRLGGSGTAAVKFDVGGSIRWLVDGSGNYIANVDNNYDIGASGANRPRNAYIAGDINYGGNLYGGGIQVGTTLFWSGKTVLNGGTTNGNLKITDNAGTSFGLFQFGGTTSSFPAIKRSSAILQAKLADDSGFTRLQAILRTDANATTGLTAGVLAATTNATIVIEDASGQAYRIPCII